MTLFRTVAPAAEPVTLAEAKAYLRLRMTARTRCWRADPRGARGSGTVDGRRADRPSWRLALDALAGTAIVAIAASGEGDHLGDGLRHRGRGRLVDPGDYSWMRRRGRRGSISRGGRSRCGS